MNRACAMSVPAMPLFNEHSTACPITPANPSPQVLEIVAVESAAHVRSPSCRYGRLAPCAARSELRRRLSSPRPSVWPRLPTPPSPHRSLPAGFPAAPTPPATRRPPALSRTSRPRPHPPLRHAATALPLPPVVSSPPRSCAHSSSPYACLHSPGSCCHRSPHVPASPAPPSDTTATLA